MQLLRRLEKSPWLLVEDIIFQPFEVSKERIVINDMFFMFVIVEKVVNLLLPFVTCMIFFLCSFCILLALDVVMVEVISFNVRRSFLFIFLFLSNKIILIRNLFFWRCFCAVCLSYTQILECLLWSMVLPTQVETPPLFYQFYIHDKI